MSYRTYQSQLPEPVKDQYTHDLQWSGAFWHDNKERATDALEEILKKNPQKPMPTRYENGRPRPPAENDNHPDINDFKDNKTDEEQFRAMLSYTGIPEWLQPCAETIVNELFNINFGNPPTNTSLYSQAVWALKKVCEKGNRQNWNGDMSLTGADALHISKLWALTIYGSTDKGYGSLPAGVKNMLEQAGLTWMMVPPDERLVPECWSKENVRQIKNLDEARKLMIKTGKLTVTNNSDKQDGHKLASKYDNAIGRARTVDAVIDEMFPGYEEDDKITITKGKLKELVRAAMSRINAEDRQRNLAGQTSAPAIQTGPNIFGTTLSRQDRTMVEHVTGPVQRQEKNASIENRMQRMEKHMATMKQDISRLTAESANENGKQTKDWRDAGAAYETSWLTWGRKRSASSEEDKDSVKKLKGVEH